MKTKYVSFHPAGARIYTNQRPPEEHPWVQDPDLSAVEGLAPHEWKLVDGKVVPHDAICAPAEVEQVCVVPKKARNWLPVLIYAAGIITGVVISLIARAL